MENDLKKQVAEFRGKLLWIARFHRVENFVGFLDEEFAQRFVGLLAVPGTPGGRAETRLEGDEFFEPAARCVVARRDANTRLGGGDGFRVAPFFAPLRLWLARLFVAWQHGWC